MSNQFSLDEIPEELRAEVIHLYTKKRLGIYPISKRIPLGQIKIQRILREAGVKRMKRGNNSLPSATPGFKFCGACQTEKPIEAFGNHTTTQDGLRSHCKSCHVEANHWLGLKRRYGVDRAQYEQMLREQNGVCAICGEPEKYKNRTRLSVDHSHTTGAVRKLLCHRCNITVGLVRECPELCGRIQAYLLGQNGE